MAIVNTTVDLTQFLSGNALNGGLKSQKSINASAGMAALLQQQFGSDRAQIQSVTYAELAGLTNLPDFTSVFVSDYGGNGKGSLWWKHPVSGFIPVDSKNTLKRPPPVNSQRYTGLGTPDWEQIYTLTLPGIPSGFYACAEIIANAVNYSESDPGGVRIVTWGGAIIPVTTFSASKTFNGKLILIQHDPTTVYAGVNGALQVITSFSINQEFTLNLEAKTTKVPYSITTVNLFDFYLQS